MSWKKNAFSCLMWAAYLLIVGTAMVFTGRVICDSFGMGGYFEIIIPAGYLLFAGILVFALHWTAVRLNVGIRSPGEGFAWMEGALVLALFAAGIFLRTSRFCSEPFTGFEESMYLKLAHVSADGQGLPQFSHGAVYFYLWALRLCFLLLGNKAAAAVWMQIILQMLGALLLYLSLRKMAGRVPSVVSVAFFMLTPYMVEKSLVLSPDMLYLLLFSSVLLFVSRGVKHVFGLGFWLVSGMAAALLCYLDLAGFLLLPLMLGVILIRRPGEEKKIADGIAGVLIGFLAGACVCILADAFGSGKPALGILRAWAELYRGKGLQLSVTISGFDTVWMITLLLCFMAWGVFGFWCSKGADRFTAWTFCLCAGILMQCLGMYTEEMDGLVYIFLFSTVLAGLGIKESMTVYPVRRPDTEGKLPWEELLGPETYGGTEEDSDEDLQELETDMEAEEEIETVPEEKEEAEIQWEALSRPETDVDVQELQTDAGMKEEEEAVAEENEEAYIQWEALGRPGTDHGPEGHGQKPQTGKGTKEERKTMGEKDKTERADMAEENVNPVSRERAPENIADMPVGEGTGVEEPQMKRKIEFLENPLPLPKKHEKRVMDYKLDSNKELEGYDVFVAEDDDFDL